MPSYIIDEEDTILHEPNLRSCEANEEFNVTFQKDQPQLNGSGSFTNLHFIRESILKELLCGCDAIRDSFHLSNFRKLALSLGIWHAYIDLQKAQMLIQLTFIIHILQSHQFFFNK